GMFAVGAPPARLAPFIGYGVRGPARGAGRGAGKDHPPMRVAFARIFSPMYARRTVLNSLYLLVSIVGLWAGSVHVPTSIREIASRQGFTAAEGTRLASDGTELLSAGTSRVGLLRAAPAGCYR